MKCYAVLGELVAVALTCRIRGISGYIFLVIRLTMQLDRINRSLRPYTGRIRQFLGQHCQIQAGIGEIAEFFASEDFSFRHAAI